MVFTLPQVDFHLFDYDDRVGMNLHNEPYSGANNTSVLGRAYCAKPLLLCKGDAVRLRLGYGVWIRHTNDLYALCCVRQLTQPLCCDSHVLYDTSVTMRHAPSNSDSDGVQYKVIHAQPTPATHIIVSSLSSSCSTDTQAMTDDIRMLLLESLVCTNVHVDTVDHRFDIVRVEPDVPIVRVTRHTRITITTTTTGGNNITDAVIVPLDLQRWPYGCRGVLLYGPSGVGKTTLVRHLAEKWSCALFTIDSASIDRRHSVGGTEAQLRNVFEAAAAAAAASTSNRHSIVFIDDIDGLCPVRRAGTASQTVAQLLTLMDGLRVESERLLVFGATQDPNSIDRALRRPGRFDKEIELSPPSRAQRLTIIRALVTTHESLPISALDTLADACVGYVVADFIALCSRAMYYASKDRIPMPHAHHYDTARMEIVPSSRRGHEIRMATTKWDDIGGYDDVKRQLRRVLEFPLLRATECKRLGVRQPSGILLYGPPGCSKTTLVKAAAQSCNIALLVINGASVISAYVGVTESNLRQVFARARANSPCLVLIDEIDALVSRRSSVDGGDSYENRVLVTLLEEMDGVRASSSVTVVGTTNRVDMLDEALCRPGRFDYLIEVPLPRNPNEREQIFRACSRHMPLCASTVDFTALAHSVHANASGADIKGICREAGMNAIRTNRTASVVKQEDFMRAIHAVIGDASDQ